MTSHSSPSSPAEVPAMQSAAVPAPSSKQRNWLIWLAGLIVVLGGGFALWRLIGGGGGQQGMQMPGAVPVTLQRLQSANVREQAEFVGTLDAASGVMLQPEAAGRITGIFVSPGDRVSAGDPIMQLSADRSQAELSAALANVSAARSARDNSRSQLQSLLAQQAQFQAEVDLQNTEFDRSQRLVVAGALSQQRLDEIERDRSAAIASLNAARQEIEAARASIEQSESFLNQAQSSANATREDLQDKTVTAPIDGIVGDIPVELGDYVQPGAELTTITLNDTLELEISIPAEQADEVQLGMPVELSTFGSDTPAATGSISFISPQTDSSTQTVLAKAEFVDAAERLQDNQRVNARVILDERTGLLVPATAITRLGGQPFVYVAVDAPPPEEGAEGRRPEGGAAPGAPADAPSQVAQLRPVTLGDMQGNDFQVLDGLSQGETIVTSGLLNLQDGMPIIPQEEGAGGPPGGPPGGEAAEEGAAEPAEGT
ncbi:MAG: efflux RND transporter periplasmic adaptor subunit [Cyanobacteria bacterium J06628_6]